MAYTDGKAAGRRTTGDHAGIKPAPAPDVRSNQEKTQGQTAIFRTYSTTSPSIKLSNQLKIDAQGKGLNVAGRPSSEAVGNWDKSLPAVENPSGSRNRPGSY